MEINFNGKRALVTGASKGIGRDVAKQLAACGAKVVAIGRAKDDLESLKKEVPSIKTVILDIANDWNETKNVISQLGDIDLLVNNAGQGYCKAFSDMTEEDYETIFGVNTKALFVITQVVVKNLLDRNVPGSIVNVSSLASLVGIWGHTVYSGAKSAVDGFTRSLALELGPKNIRVNTVNPTVILTDMGIKFWSDPAKAIPMKAKIPLNRFGEVREVTDAILYLLSDKSSMITGHSLPVDGGYYSA